MADEPVAIGPEGMGPAEVVAVARAGARVVVSPAAVAAIAASRARVEELAAGQVPAYGISTGFGALATRAIPVADRAQLQRSLIRSHAAGSGAPVEAEVVRALMLLRLRTLATGRTGVRAEVALALAALLNAGITPLVPEFGSLGCSGDLAPLAHVALALMGEGDVEAPGGPENVGPERVGPEHVGPEHVGHECAAGGEVHGATSCRGACTDPSPPRVVPAARALADAGLSPIVLAEKEGLALINGTDGMLGMLVLACHDLAGLVRHADLAAAMSVEALLGTDQVFAADLAALRPHPGQAAAAANMRALLAGSPIVASHAGPEDTRVQDAYSLRCAPQVAGAVRDTLTHAQFVAARELRAAIDNPVVLADGRVESNGNFHGAPVAYVLDFLAIAVADMASISERRTDRLLDVKRSHGLPPFLAHDPGVDSGYMIAQYTQAGIVSELKRLAVPASVDSIPSSAMQEDHVSMGWAAGRKLRRALDGLTRVLAIEIAAAARALDLRAPLTPAPGTGAALAALRRTVPGPGPDRYLAPDLAAAVTAVRSGVLLAAAESVTGTLS
ncbi:MAG: histidine ammonia-lyase [Sporichthyaceae bacterium]